MRTLILSNYFPPCARGGYEQWCAEVAVELRHRGHDVLVVTGRERHTVSPSYQGIPVHRILNLEAQEGMWETASRFFLRRRELERESLDRTQQLLDELKPDVAFIWGMWNVPRSIPALIERYLSERVAYYFCDYWPSLPSAYEQYWLTPSGHTATKFIKHMAGKIALRSLRNDPIASLRLTNCYCVSQSVCDQLTSSGVLMARSKVIYGGTQVEQFDANGTREPDFPDRHCLRLLYAGRITPDKGVHTVIEAISMLPLGSVALSICGDDNSVYGQNLRRMARDLDVSDHVVFTGRVPRSEIPSVMAQHDVLVFPSIWEEPFARIVLEGMAANMLVVGTTAGGTKEILIDGETGLTFPPGDVAALASQLTRLLTDSELLDATRQNGHRIVRECFRFDQMVDALEIELQTVAFVQSS